MILFLPYVAAAIAALVGFGANWWLGVTDWQTAVVFATALVACVFVMQTDKPWARLATAGIIGVALYLKGGIDKETHLLIQHENEKQQIHNAYAKAAQVERQRQLEANALAEHNAREEKERRDAELAAAQEQIKQLQTEAARDPRASSPAFSADAMRRLNARRVRGRAGS